MERNELKVAFAPSLPLHPKIPSAIPWARLSREVDTLKAEIQAQIANVLGENWRTKCTYVPLRRWKQAVGITYQMLQKRKWECPTKLSHVTADG